MSHQVFPLDKYRDVEFLPHFRLPSPQVYKKLLKTEKLLDKGVALDQLEKKGGLSFRNYNYFWEFFDKRQKSMGEFLNDYNLFNQYKSTSNLNYHKNVTGKRRIIVLLVDFKDKIHQTSPKHYQELLFSKGTQIGSLRDYFLEVSWNQLDIEGDVFGWFRAKNNYKNYWDDIRSSDPMKKQMPNAQKLVRETVKNLSKNYSLNYANYDNDGNKIIDTLIVVYAGEGADVKGDIDLISPHQYRLNPPEPIDGYKVKNYVLMHELPDYDLGGFCHELAHTLGVPDFYSPIYKNTMLGKWCLMGWGDRNNQGRTPGHMNPWCKIHLGWVKPIIIDDKPDWVSIKDIGSSKDIYKIIVQSSNGKEYFLVENRQLKGFNSHLPSSGLLIWHVDEEQAIDIYPNCNPPNYFLTLIQADGKNELEVNVEAIPTDASGHKRFSDYGLDAVDLTGDAGDAYPGLPDTDNRDFNNKSTPNNLSFHGKNSCVVINSISDSGDLMMAKMGIYCDNFNEEYDQDIPSFEIKKDPCHEIIKKEACLEQYQDGYRKGFSKGYEIAIKKLKK